MNRNFKRTSLKKWFFNIFSVFIDILYINSYYNIHIHYINILEL